MLFTTMKHNSTYYRELLERYFEGTTTEAEERVLRRFLSSSAADAPEWEEGRAVMGLFAALRRRRREGRGEQAFRMWQSRPLRYAAVAALLALVALPALFRSGDAEEDIEGFAYIGGQRTTNRDVLLREAFSALSATSRPEDAAPFEGQLRDILTTD